MRFEDADFLDQQYGTSEGLAVRIETHRRYGTASKDIFEELTEKARDELEPLRILDVGAGDGNWYRTLRRVLGSEPFYVGLDRSDGMVEHLREAQAGDARAQVVRGDAQALPWTLPEFDWVGMHFMLYHVPDIPRAIAEAWRILRPGGLLLAATVSTSSYRELAELQLEGLRAMGYSAARIAQPSDRFSLETGAQYFPVRSEILDCPGGLRFDAAEPALRYLASGPIDAAIAQAGAPASLRRDLLAYVGQRIDAEIRRAGSFTVRSKSGCFVVTKR